MAWFYLFVAGILEIVWAYAMKQSHGFSRLIPSLVTLGFRCDDLVCLAYGRV